MERAGTASEEYLQAATTSQTRKGKGGRKKIKGKAKAALSQYCYERTRARMLGYMVADQAILTNAAANPGAPVQTEPETVDFFLTPSHCWTKRLFKATLPPKEYSFLYLSSVDLRLSE